MAVTLTISTSFVEELLEQTDDIVVGRISNKGTDLGLLNNDGMVEKMNHHVRDPKTKDATILRGGNPVADAPTDRYDELPSWTVPRQRLSLISENRS